MAIENRELNLLKNILTKYSVNAEKIHTAQKGYRNNCYKIETNNQFLNLIIYKSEKDIFKKIKNANNVSDLLYSKGFLTRKTIDPRIIKIAGTDKIRFACLYNYLPGNTISWEAYTRRHIKELGIKMREIHFELADIQSPWIKDIPKQQDEIRFQVATMVRYFSDANVKKAMNSKLSTSVNTKIWKLTEIILNKISKIETNQILHMDFVRSNILFRNQNSRIQISGIIDFEKTARGPAIFDITRTLAFLLIDCKYKSESEIKKNFLYYGYTNKGEFKIENYKYLDFLLNFFWLYDFYKFLKHNPYESLEYNEHFVRTRDILLRNKVLILQK